MSTETFTRDGLTFRRAVEKDIPAILAFTDIYLRRDWLVRREYLWDVLHRDTVWVVLDGVKVVAWAVVGKSKGLWNLLVHPDYRGRHIGQALVERLKPDYIRSKSDQSSGDPTAFYARLGYETVESKVGRKRNINVMRKRDLTQ